MAPPQLAEEQINCGPFFENIEIGGRFISLATPHGKYDLAAIAAKLPADQQPDVVVCLVDACGRNLPSNLAAFKCPKVLLLADTHHMVRPIVSMLQYVSTERFDRIIFLYTRHHIDVFRSAGVNNIHWLPSLTLPYSDATLRAVRQEHREPCLAHVGYLGALHYRRLRLAGCVAAAKLPLVLREVPQREALRLYGSSLIVLNVSANSDLNLRVFETMAAGSMLLMDRLAAESGVAQLWREGGELVTYDSPDDMVDKARHYLAHPEQAREIGRAGEQWFDRHYNEERRRTLFRELVLEGKEQPEFVVPTPRPPLIQFGGQAALTKQALLVYEFVQTMHSCQEVVRIGLDETAPEDFRRLCETLPRVEVRRLERPVPGGRPSAGAFDFLVVSADRVAAFAGTGAKCIWCWNAGAADLPGLRSRLAASGLRQNDQDVAFFCRPEAEVVPTVLESSKSAKARLIMRGGALQVAFELAKQAIMEAPAVADSHIVMAEIAVELGNRETVTRALAKARSLDPNNPRIPIVEQAWEGGQQRRIARWLDIAYKALDAKELPKAIEFANRALTAAPEHPPALALAGAIFLARAAHGGGRVNERDHMRGVQALQAAAENAPDRPDFWHALAVARRTAGFFAKAAEAWEKSLALDKAQPLAWFGLGEACLRLGETVRARDAFARGLNVSPGDRMLMRWLGHACRRLGDARQAWLWHARSFGAAIGDAEAARSSRAVVFVVSSASEWVTVQPVLEEAKKAAEFDVSLVVLPSDSAEGESLLTAIKASGHACETTATLVPEAGFANLVILGNGNDFGRPPEWRIPALLATGARIGYLPHDLICPGRSSSTDADNWDSELVRLAAVVFGRNEADRVGYGRRCLSGNTHVVTTGHPKLDYFVSGVRHKNALKEFAAGRPLVCWNPHHDVRIGPPSDGGGATFLKWMDVIPQEMARRPDLALVIRPHPRLWKNLSERGALTTVEIDQFLRRCAEAGNIHIDRELFPLAVLAEADALLSDPSSLLVEFSASGRAAACLTTSPTPLQVWSPGGYRAVPTIDTHAELAEFLDLVSCAPVRTTGIAADHDTAARRIIAWIAALVRKAGESDSEMMVAPMESSNVSLPLLDYATTTHS